jgi:multiple sugar transport system substrate-binding protein
MRHRPVTRWRGASALLALALAFALGACAAPAAPEPPGAPTAPAAQPAPADPSGATAPAAAEPTGDPGVVTIGFAAPEFERAAYEPLIEAFNQQNRDVQVQFVVLEQGPVQSIDQLVRQAVSAADTAASFFLRPEDIANGLVRDLKPLLEADPSFERDDYYPGALAPADAGGGIYLLPRTLQLSLLSYNKDLWAQRGLPPPKPGWTWSDLLAAAEQLAQRRGDTVDVYGLAEGSTGIAALSGLLAEAGVDRAALAAGRARIDQPAVAAALQRVAELAKSGAIYSGQPLQPDALLKLIADQRAAMWFDAPVIVGPDVPKPSFATGLATLPPTGGPRFGGAEGYIMSSGTQHPEAAWRWLAFLSKQELRRPFVEAGTLTSAPARKSLAEKSGFWKQLDVDAAAAVHAALEQPGAALAGFSANDNLVADALGQALAAVVGGKRSATQALADAQAQLDSGIAAALATPSPTPDKSPVMVATPAPDGPAPGATAITFNVPLFEASQLRRLAQDFNRQHPELFVKLNGVPLDEKASLAKMATGGDCFFWPDPAAASQISGTLDLQPLADADPSFDLSDYPPALLAPFRRGTGLYGLPYQVRLQALTYNQTAFDAAGLAHPSASWTAADFLSAAQRLTSGGDADKRYGYAALGEQTGNLLYFLGLLGAQVTRGGAPNFTDPQVEQALRTYIDLLRNSSPHQRIQGYSRALGFDGAAFELIEQGRIGMWFDLPSGMNIARVGVGAAERPSFTRAIAPPPGADKASASSFEATGLYISATSQQPQACWEWLKFLGADLSALGGNFPARRSLAVSDAFTSGAPAGAAEVYAAYRPALDRAPSGAEPPDQHAADLYWLFRAADRALQGKDLGRELADAQALTASYLACVRAGGAAGSCAKQADPSYDGFAAAGGTS